MITGVRNYYVEANIWHYLCTQFVLKSMKASLLAQGTCQSESYHIVVEKCSVGFHIKADLPASDEKEYRIFQ